MHLIGTLRPAGDVLPHAHHRHAEGLAQPRDAPADAPQPDHHRGLAAGLVLALGEVALHAAPDALGLVVACLGDAAQQCQHQGDRVFADGIGVDALAAGEADAGRLQHIAVILVGAGGAGLHEAQPGRDRRQVVAPHARADQHIHPGGMRVEFLARARLDEADAGVARGEAVTEAIGDMGETDGQLVARRQHRWALPVQVGRDPGRPPAAAQEAPGYRRTVPLALPVAELPPLPPPLAPPANSTAARAAAAMPAAARAEGPDRVSPPGATMTMRCCGRGGGARWVRGAASPRGAMTTALPGGTTRLRVCAAAGGATTGSRARRMKNLLTVEILTLLFRIIQGPANRVEGRAPASHPRASAHRPAAAPSCIRRQGGCQRSPTSGGANLTAVARGAASRIDDMAGVEVLASTIAAPGPGPRVAVVAVDAAEAPRMLPGRAGAVLRDRMQAAPGLAARGARPGSPCPSRDAACGAVPTAFRVPCQPGNRALIQHAAGENPWT